MVPCELELYYTPSVDAPVVQYDLVFPPMGNKIGINLIDDGDFNILYVLSSIPNSP